MTASLPDRPSRRPSPSPHRRILLIGAPALALSAASAGALAAGGLFGARRGSGVLRRELRRPGAFDTLQLATGARVLLRQADVDELQVEADDDLIGLIETVVDDGVLRIGDRRAFESPLAQVTVTLRHLSRLSLGEQTALRCDGLVVPKLDIAAGGQSALRLQGLTAERVSLQAGGASAVVLAGQVNELSAALGGAASLEAGALEARDVSVQAGGTAQAVVWARQQLSAQLGGVSGLRYRGSPQTRVQQGGKSTLSPLGPAAGG